MGRDRGKLGPILQAVVERLIDQMPNEQFTAANCYLTLKKNADPVPGLGDRILTVSPQDQEFAGPYFEGGGEQQATTFEDVLVIKLWSFVELDETNRSTEWLTNETLGVCELMRQVFKAMTNWSPGPVGSEYTRDPFSPGGYSFLENAVEMRFRYVFDWDLD